MEVRYRIARPYPLEAAFELGRFTALLGPSGAGKTTLIRALAGLVPGRGTPYGGLPAERRPVGYLPQNLALFPHLNAWQNVAFPLAHLPPGERKERALALLGRFGLSEKADRRPAELSGGEARRVALARALAREPELILLDEPTAGLDRPNRSQVLRAILAALSSGNVRALVATHDPELAQAADRVVVLERGKVLQEGPSDRVFNHPASPRVAQLLGYENRFSGRVVQREGELALLATEAGRLYAKTELPVGTRVGIFLRPEEVLIVREGRPLSPVDAQNTLVGRLRCVRRMGPVVEAEFQGRIELLLRLPRHVEDRLGLATGEIRRVVLKPRYLQLFSEEEDSFSSE